MNYVQRLSSSSDEWSTPIDLFNSLNNEFHFTLDPCSSDSNHLCDTYFTKSDNGLIKSWKDHIVFCNPPYSRISDWVYKAYTEWIKNHVTTVMLIPVRTDTVYFHNYIYPYANLVFLRGRLRFSGSKCNAPFPSMLVIFR